MPRSTPLSAHLSGVRQWRIIQVHGEKYVTTWAGTDERLARKLYEQHDDLAPAWLTTLLQFQDPPEEPPWETVATDPIGGRSS